MSKSNTFLSCGCHLTASDGKGGCKMHAEIERLTAACKGLSKLATAHGKEIERLRGLLREWMTPMDVNVASNFTLRERTEAALGYTADQPPEPRLTSEAEAMEHSRQLQRARLDRRLTVQPAADQPRACSYTNPCWADDCGACGSRSPTAVQPDVPPDALATKLAQWSGSCLIDGFHWDRGEPTLQELLAEAVMRLTAQPPSRPDAYLVEYGDLPGCEFFSDKAEHAARSVANDMGGTVTPLYRGSLLGAAAQPTVVVGGRQQGKTEAMGYLAPFVREAAKQYAEAVQPPASDTNTGANRIEPQPDVAPHYVTTQTEVPCPCPECGKPMRRIGDYEFACGIAPANLTGEQ
jgi:hypothetical protein